MRPPILTTDERRDGNRCSFHSRVQVLVAGRPPMIARSYDISASGIGMVLDVDLGAGSTCALLFKLVLANGVIFDARSAATVAYSLLSAEHSGFKTGARFASPSPDLLKAVARFIDDAASSPFGR